MLSAATCDGPGEADLVVTLVLSHGNGPFQNVSAVPKKRVVGTPQRAAPGEERIYQGKLMEIIVKHGEG